MKIRYSIIEPFGYTGIPTITDSDVTISRIEDALFEAWMEIWNNDECRGASLRRILAFLKGIAEKNGGRNAHCQMDKDTFAMQSVIVWYKLPCGGFKGTRLFFQ